MSTEENPGNGDSGKAKLASEQMSEPGKFFGKIFDPAQNVSTGFVPKDLALKELPATYKVSFRQLIRSTNGFNSIDGAS